MRSLASRLSVMALSVALLVGLLPSTGAARSSNPVVMTRNLYLGADLAPAITAPDAATLVQAAADIYRNVVATDFPARAKLIAAEIQQSSPDLIGLQEVSLWRTGPFSDPAPATTVAYDYLATLQAELAALGLDYTAAVVQENSDVEAPAAFSSSGDPVLMDVRLTQRNAILVRNGISYSNARSVQFDTNNVFSNVGGIPGNDLVDVRGWVSVDVRMEPKKKPFRFVNTHLESFVPSVREAQAREMIDGPLSGTLKVIAVGDFNSPPPGGAYGILTSPSAGKVRDAWIAANGAAGGYTFSQAADLLNPGDQATVRIDLILTRTPALRVLDARLVGTIARTPGGLWASDHFGVVAELSMP